MRGIGVAVMCSTCGAASPGPLGVERRALADAEAVLLVDDADGEPGELDVGLDQRVGADHQAELAAGEPVERLAPARRRRRAGEQRERDRLGGRAARRGSTACCSASVSVGAISAAWWPASSARSIA